MAGFPKNEKLMAIESALNMARSIKERIDFSKDEYAQREKYLIRFEIEWHRKFTLSIACLILFFIGAPLGAIIRKGGLGLPVVVSVIFFIIFHVISITGEKFVREGVIPAWQGMWIAALVFLPLGIFLTVKATTDSKLFDTDSYLKGFERLYKWRKRKKPA
jgi:lipopolysaccharide export system permease protein